MAAQFAQRIAAGSLTWKEYGGTHPIEAGNRLAADLIEDLGEGRGVGGLVRLEGLSLRAAIPASPDLGPSLIDHVTGSSAYVGTDSLEGGERQVADEGPEVVVGDEAVQAGRLQPGDLVLLCGFGAGLAWGTTLLRW